ncbi:MAG TPA: oxygen-dependent coproporphyrinogen oxidase [Ignavibacteriaceae bacterium]|nr:oxygen-dependent coproporphyrinogen oxidase [Ignavibacteriaceae bacterium]
MMEYKPSNRYKHVENYTAGLQKVICTALEKLDANSFSDDQWIREQGGGGITKVIENGRIFEKGAVNISGVFGILPAEAAVSLKIKPQEFAASGLSLILHPYSPKIPTVHMNIRYFEIAGGKSWFGGGTDLTPYYPYPEDFRHFHNTLKEACDSVAPGLYPMYKKNCDEYFTIKHRNEMRGIGGIFFDYLNGNDESNLRLIKSLGDSFLESYIPIVKKRESEKYTDDDKIFQLIRRGRYVEFNLLYDKGTLFGLKTGGRIESVLASLPPEAKYIYNYKARPGSVQEEMLSYYQPRNWLV